MKARWGDVLSEAKRVLKETRVLEESMQLQKESVEEYREHVEDVKYREAIKELIGEGVEDVKGVVAGMVNEWTEKKNQLEREEKEIEGGVLQFRADKVASKYRVPRKIVGGAFRAMVEEGKGEIILPEEGAKDILLVVR